MLGSVCVITLKKQKREIALMHEAGKLLAACHQQLAKLIEPGITTMELDRIAEKFFCFSMEPSRSKRDIRATRMRRVPLLMMKFVMAFREKNTFARRRYRDN
ncbi:hypothetical protein GCM10020331_016770 [Ectobacillus funiculus]